MLTFCEPAPEEKRAGRADKKRHPDIYGKSDFG
jgi:hypothetical protein